jgi:hypothetical protein
MTGKGPTRSSAGIKNIFVCFQAVIQGRLQSSWNHLITPSRNVVEVRWRSLFRSTSLGKRCISYNAPPTSRKRAADRSSLRNFLPWSSLFMVRKAQKSHGVRYELISVFDLEKVDRWNPTRTSVIQMVMNDQSSKNVAEMVLALLYVLVYIYWT